MATDFILRSVLYLLCTLLIQNASSFFLHIVSDPPPPFQRVYNRIYQYIAVYRSIYEYIQNLVYMSIYRYIGQYIGVHKSIYRYIRNTSVYRST